MAKNLHDYRKSYEKGVLDIDSVLKNPFNQFENWFHEAEQSKEVDEPNAMTLSTIGVDGFPRGRVVLLKEFHQEGFIFYTNYESEKGQSIAVNPQVSIAFFWPALERQIMIKGMATKVSEEESTTYFAQRPRKSQLGALVSNQSEVILNRKALEARLEVLEREFDGKKVPRPLNWGGYQIAPTEFEFWQGRSSRLHDRIRYTQVKKGVWQIDRLQP